MNVLPSRCNSLTVLSSICVTTWDSLSVCKCSFREKHKSQQIFKTKTNLNFCFDLLNLFRLLPPTVRDCQVDPTCRSRRSKTSWNGERGEQHEHLFWASVGEPSRMGRSPVYTFAVNNGLLFKQSLACSCLDTASFLNVTTTNLIFSL